MSRICFQDSYYRQPRYQTHFGARQKREKSSNSVSDASASMKSKVSVKNTSDGDARKVVAQYQETLEKAPC